MKHLKVGFIGAGNMATSIIGGLLEQGLPVDNIRACDPNAEALDRLKNLAPIALSTDNRDAVADADIVVLAVKPQTMADVTAGIREAVAAERATVLSIAAGITVASLERSLGEKTSIIRSMPNTPALLRSGASAMFANAAASEAQRHIAEAVLGAVGTVCWVAAESDLDTVTALSGSGPAYFFLMLEAMAEAAERMGLGADIARPLAAQTALGAARMALESEESVAELRRRVTSPGGTTQAALEYFENAGFRAMVDGAMSAAAERSRELSREME